MMISICTLGGLVYACGWALHAGGDLRSSWRLCTRADVVSGSSEDVLNGTVVVVAS